MRVNRREISGREARQASQRWWDGDAAAYDQEHSQFLGRVRFIWCPEGVDEAEARLLGEVTGRRVLEVGCGSAPCGRWLRTQGAEIVSLDLSAGMLAVGRAANASTGVAVPLLQADACALPIASASVDIAFSAFGAVPFVADPGLIMGEVARVLRPGGSWAFSVTHPMRWCFPDDPGPQGLVAGQSYFDRMPYVETDEAGVPAYVETHRTMADRIRDIRSAGLMLEELIEPEWTQASAPWGQWSPLRGAIFPGTAIFRARKPG